jgi:hypothetical protein
LPRPEPLKNSIGTEIPSNSNRTQEANDDISIEFEDKFKEQSMPFRSNSNIIQEAQDDISTEGDLNMMTFPANSNEMGEDKRDISTAFDSVDGRRAHPATSTPFRPTRSPGLGQCRDN